MLRRSRLSDFCSVISAALRKAGANHHTGALCLTVFDIKLPPTPVKSLCRLEVHQDAFSVMHCGQFFLENLRPGGVAGGLCGDLSHPDARIHRKSR